MKNEFRRGCLADLKLAKDDIGRAKHSSNLSRIAEHFSGMSYIMSYTFLCADVSLKRIPKLFPQSSCLTLKGGSEPMFDTILQTPLAEFLSSPLPLFAPAEFLQATPCLMAITPTAACSPEIPKAWGF